MIRVAVEFPAPGSADEVGAWALDLLGCHANGRDEREARDHVRPAIERYLRHTRDLGSVAPTGEIDVVERYRCRWEGRYEVNALFEDDLRPATAAEVDFVRAMLARTRAALLEAVATPTRRHPDERAPEQVLHHVASTDWFYASRSSDDPETRRREGRSEELDAKKRLALVREWALARIGELPGLGDRRWTHQGEIWTPRKILRRFAYHELDHVSELEDRAPALPRADAPRR